MLHRALVVLYALLHAGIILILIFYYNDYQDSKFYEDRYVVECIANGEPYFIQGDIARASFSEAELSRPGNKSAYERWFRFGCAYYDERQVYLDAYNQPTSLEERALSQSAYRDFELRASEVSEKNFKYVEIVNEKDEGFYLKLFIEPILVMIGLWLLLQIGRILYIRKQLRLFTWHPYSLAKAKPLSDRVSLDFKTSHEWARESYKKSVMSSMQAVRYVSVIFLLLVGPALWLYGYLLFNFGFEGMLEASALIGVIVLIPLSLFVTAYILEKKTPDTSHWKIATVSFLGLLIGVLVSTLWLVYSYLEGQVVLTSNMTATWGFLSIFGLAGFLYTIKLFGCQFTLVYKNYLKNKYSDPEGKTIDSSDYHFLNFVFRLLYPRVNTEPELHRAVLIVGWLLTFLSVGLAFFVYFGVVQRIIYYVVYGNDVSKWKSVEELTLE